jgi:hypothetical protein
VETSAIVLEGGCFEVARCFYWYRLPRDLGVDVDAATEAILERFPTQRPAGVRAWVEWALGPGQQPDLDWRDRFYLEQRCGGALSSGLQGFDISGLRMLYLANCHTLLEDLLSAPHQLRMANRVQGDVIEALAPALAVHPYNPGSRQDERAHKEAAAATHKRGGRRWSLTRLRGRKG